MIPSNKDMTLTNIRDRSAAPLKRLKQGLAQHSVLLLVITMLILVVFAVVARRTSKASGNASWDSLL